jgi:hypothetical protein
MNSLELTHAMWFVSYLLNVPTNTSNDQISDLADFLAGRCGTVSCDGQDLRLSFIVPGQMDLVIQESRDIVAAAVTSVGIPNYHLRSVRMVDEQDMASQLTRNETPRMLSVTETARVLGVSKQRVSAMMRSGKLPEPDGYIGDTPGFFPSTVADFAAHRAPRLEDV